MDPPANESSTMLTFLRADTGEVPHLAVSRQSQPEWLLISTQKRSTGDAEKTWTGFMSQVQDFVGIR